MWPLHSAFTRSWTYCKGFWYPIQYFSMRSKSILCYSQIIAVPKHESCTKWAYLLIKWNSVCNNRFRRPSLILSVSNLKKLALMTEIIKAKFNQESISGRLCTKQKKSTIFVKATCLGVRSEYRGNYPSSPHCLAWSIQKIIANVAAFHSNDIKPLSARIPNREFPRTASSGHHQYAQRAKSHEKARLFLYTEKFAKVIVSEKR